MNSPCCAAICSFDNGTTESIEPALATSCEHSRGRGPYRDGAQGSRFVSPFSPPVGAYWAKGDGPRSPVASLADGVGCGTLVEVGAPSRRGDAETGGAVSAVSAFGLGAGRGVSGRAGSGAESAIRETEIAGGVGARARSGLPEAAISATTAAPTTQCATTEPAAGACLRHPTFPTHSRMLSQSTIARDYARAMG